MQLILIITDIPLHCVKLMLVYYLSIVFATELLLPPYPSLAKQKYLLGLVNMVKTNEIEAYQQQKRIQQFFFTCLLSTNV